MSNTKRLAGWIQENRDKVSDQAPKRWSPDKVQRLALHLLQESDDNLQSCTPASLVQCILRAAHLELDIELGEAHLVPRRTGPNGEYEAHLRLDYKGLVKLAQRSPAVVDVHARVVREGDEIALRQTEDGVDFTHEPEVFGNGDVVGAYCFIEKVEGQPRIELMNRADLQAVRDKADSGSFAWKDFPNEMRKKAVTRRALKWVDLDPEARDVMQQTDQLQYDLQQTQDPSRQVDGDSGGLNALIDGSRPEQPNGQEAPRQIESSGGAPSTQEAVSRLKSVVVAATDEGVWSDLLDALKYSKGDGSVESLPASDLADMADALDGASPDDAQDRIRQYLGT